MVLSAIRGLRRLRNALFVRLVRRRFAAFGKDSTIHLPADLLGVENIFIGDDVHMYPGCIIQSHLGGKIEIGDRVEIRDRAILTSQALVQIGRGCIISRGVHLSDHTHGYDDPNLDVVDQPGPPPKPVRIGRGTWIGQNAVVLPGVTVGERAVIGAGSIVNKDVPPYAVVVGTPARLVRLYHEAD